MTVNKRSVCDGIRIDKNLIAIYHSKLQQGTANFQLESVYYSAKGKRCQSGNCNKKISNVFVFVDKDTGQEYEIGSHCAAKYGNDVNKLVQYWLTKLNYATANTLKKAKREEAKRIAMETHRERYEFAQAYLEINRSNFVASIVNVINQGWVLSPKQVTAIDSIMEKNPDLEAAAAEQVEKMKPHQDRIFFILSIIERLDAVSFGQRSTAYPSIREFFARNGYVSDKQLVLLEKYLHTFRRQIPEPIGV